MFLQFLFNLNLRDNLVDKFRDLVNMSILFLATNPFQLTIQDLTMQFSKKFFKKIKKK